MADEARTNAAARAFIRYGVCYEKVLGISASDFNPISKTQRPGGSALTAPVAITDTLTQSFLLFPKDAGRCNGQAKA